MFNKICIIGCGLIGSSLLRAITKKKLAKQVRVFDKSKEVSTYLIKNFSSNVSKNIDEDHISDPFLTNLPSVLQKFISKKKLNWMKK